MHPVEKFLPIAGIGLGMYSKWRIQRTVSSVVTTAMLAVVAAIMIGALTIGGFYISYVLLIAQGVTPLAALLMIGLVVLLCTMLLLNIVRKRIYTLKSSLHTPVGEAVEAFFDELFAK